MKKLNLALGVVTLFSVVHIFSSFTDSKNENANTTVIDNCTDSNIGDVTTTNNGNGNVVTIDNGQSWVWLADNCNAPLVPATSARVQYETNRFFSVTATFQLPAGHCDIPAVGAKVTRYNSDSWVVVTSDGKAIAKILYKPNDN